MTRPRPAARVALASLLLALAAGLPAAGPRAQAPPAQAFPPEPWPEEAPRPPWDLAVFPSGREFALELAVSLEERALGYMFREEIGPHEGMLFVFARDGLHEFWMRNCEVPLDLIWLDRDRRVVHVVENAPPCPPDGDCPTMQPLRNARYVLEVAGGTVAAEKLSTGDTVLFVDLDGDGDGRAAGAG